MHVEFWCSIKLFCDLTHKGNRKTAAHVAVDLQCCMDTVKPEYNKYHTA